jgi:hypothetical protein
MSDARRKNERLLVCFGCVHALLFLLSYALLTSAPGPHAPDDELIAFYASGNRHRIVLVGLYVMPFAGIAFVWFCSALRHVLQSSDVPSDELVSGAQLVSGILYVALFFTAAAAASVTAVSVELTSAPLDTAVARLFPQYGSTLMLVFAMRMAAMFVFATSRLARAANVVPRWFTYLSFACALVLLFSASLSRALVLVFPAWLLTLCALILWRNMRPSVGRVVAGALALTALAGSASAQGASEQGASAHGANAHGASERAADEWSFSLTPYYWATSFDGTLTFDGEAIEGDGSSGGFPEEFALSGFLGHFEAQKARWSFALSPVFVNIETEADDSSANDTQLDLSGAIVEGFAAYEFARGWDVLGGVRYYDLETEADVAIGGVPQPGLDSSRDWIDPIVGLRYASSFVDDWWFQARADVGGFGVGSDFAWNAVLAVGYDLSEWARLQLGYRALDFDFADGSGSDRVDYDVRLCGPLIGVTFSL